MHRQCAATTEVTVCIFEEEGYSSYWRELEVMEMLKSRLTLLDVNVTLLRSVIPDVQFLGFLLDGAALASKLVRHLSDVFIGSLILRVFDDPTLPNSMATLPAAAEAVRKSLQTVASSPFYNILLMAGLDTVRLVLQESLVLQIEELAITLGIQSVVMTILNATADNVPSDSTCHKTSNTFQHQSPQTTKTVVVEDLLADIFSSFSDAKYSICSTESEHSTLVSVGSWSSYSGLQTASEPLFRNIFRDFGNKSLRIATRELATSPLPSRFLSTQAEPFVRKRKVNGTIIFEGFCVDIIRELATVLKFRCEFVEPKDQEWGAPGKNGLWTGVIGMVLSGEADIGIGPISITSTRESVIDFTKPFMEDGLGILTKRPDSNAQSMFKMFTPLKPLVWCALVAAVIIASLSLYVIEKTSPFSSRNVNGNTQLGLLGSFWLIYGSYVEQGGDPHPRSVSARCLVGFWWLFTILMSSTYTANLAAFLTVTIEGSPVNSLTELAESSDLRPLVKQGSNPYTLFQNADNPVYREVWYKMSNMPVVKSNLEAERYVLHQHYAFITDASQLEYIMLENCSSYALAKEIFNTGGFGFVLPEKAPYLDVVNYNIMKMQEAGLIDKWKQIWWSSADSCDTNSRTSDAKELDLQSLSGIFCIFLGVALVAVLIKVLEIAFAKPKFSLLWNHMKFMIFKPSPEDTRSTTARGRKSWVEPEIGRKLSDTIDKCDSAETETRPAHENGRHMKLNKVGDTKAAKGHVNNCLHVELI
ncbi:hypothetical protein C0Q70_00180 [Pomacea canaliculata]|uniref:Glutamate receptor n=1 Tax=Pomacea canaliculata TaxID=400727 RepID=A0A2T7PVX6_POMCA|nr:hypothetical protein C0Q70_00180 [Pomacea canaliculata]